MRLMSENVPVMSRLNREETTGLELVRMMLEEKGMI